MPDDTSARQRTRVDRHRHRYRRRRSGALRGFALGARVVVALASAGALTAAAFAWSTVHQFTTGIQRGAALTPAPTQLRTGTAVPDKPKDIDGKDENILLLGNDSIAGATPAEVAALGTTMDRSDSATDTMMVLHVPADGSKATLISIPRDSWVEIPGHGMNKINAAYVDGYLDAKNKGANLLGAQSAGILLAAQTISDLTGLHIDHYVQINLLGFYRISEAIGGVRVDLCQAQHETDSGIDLPAGWSTIKGTQAMAFVRQRHGLRLGDIDRIKRQQYFLSAVFHKLVSGGTLLDLPKISRTLNAAKQSLIVDPGLDVLDFLQQFATLAAGKITVGTPPWAFAKLPDGTDIVRVDPDSVKQYVDTIIGVPADPKLAEAKTVPVGQVRVTVQNGADVAGIAGRNASALASSGFPATASDTDAHRADTAIEYPDGMQGQAKTLERYVPGAQLVESPSVSSVTLVLGANGVQVKSLMPAKTTPPPTPATSSASSAPPGTSTAAKVLQGCID